MKAVLVDESTQALYLGEIPDPAIGADDLLVRVQATALNRADLLQRRGLYPPPPGASSVLGLECAGTIEQVGSNVTGWKRGERVMALLPGGGYAQAVAIPAAMAMRVPETLSLKEAAAIPEAFLTAYLGISTLGKLQSGQWALIHAGASGVGTASIQIVREMGGRSIATAGTEQKLAACLTLGAEAAINYKTDSFQQRLHELAPEGVHVILDPVGAAYWEANLKSLAIGGRLILIAVMGGRETRTDLGLILSKRLQIIGTTLRARPLEEKVALTREFAAFALERFADGRLKPVIDSCYDWSEVNAAHTAMEQNRNIGKIVLTVS